MDRQVRKILPGMENMDLVDLRDLLVDPTQSLCQHDSLIVSDGSAFRRAFHRLASSSVQHLMTV